MGADKEIGHDTLAPRDLIVAGWARGDEPVAAVRALRLLAPRAQVGRPCGRCLAQRLGRKRIHADAKLV
jgi:hypothetical protein